MMDVKASIWLGLGKTWALAVTIHIVAEGNEGNAVTEQVGRRFSGVPKRAPNGDRKTPSLPVRKQARPSFPHFLLFKTE
jgi:hypothetical protein